jgi:LysR family cys regulon transcriptional activator
MAYDPEHDHDLLQLDASHLFAPSVTKIGFRRGMYLRGYMYEFMRLFVPHLELRRVDQAAHANDQNEVDLLFRDVELPLY